MNGDRMNGFYSVHPPEDDHGDAELGAAIGEARGALIDALESGRDPKADEEYQMKEARVAEMKARLKGEKG